MSLERSETFDYSIQRITESNTKIYLNLAHCYEAEFSNLTHKQPNAEGIFEPDTLPIGIYTGYLLYQHKTPLGFCITELSADKNDVAEFYIVPSARKKKLGEHLATTLFNLHPGQWQVRQISGADHSTAFWRKVISHYTNNHYTENTINDVDWGTVTCQTFETPNKLLKKSHSNEHLHSRSLFPLPSAPSKATPPDISSTPVSNIM